MAKVDNYAKKLKRRIRGVNQLIEYYTSGESGVAHGLAAHAVAMHQQYRDGLQNALDLVDEVWK